MPDQINSANAFVGVVRLTDKGKIKWRDRCHALLNDHHQLLK